MASLAAGKMNRKRWKLNGKLKTFEEVIEHIEGVAEQLLQRRPELAGLRVVGINFRKDL